VYQTLARAQHTRSISSVRRSLGQMKQGDLHPVKSRVSGIRWLGFDHGGIVTEKLFTDQKQSERYSKYRPCLPPQLVDKLVGVLGRRPGRVVDVGCGPGISTKQFIGQSDAIVGVDVSETQLNVARDTVVHDSVSFIQGTCDALPVDNADIVIACQAAHYFDLQAFFREVNRILVPGGVLALCCILTPTFTDHRLDNGFKHIFNEVLRPYMSPVVHDIVQTSYRTLTLPYTPRLEYTHDIIEETSYHDALEHIGTFSPFTLLCRDKGLTLEEGMEFLDSVMMQCGVTMEVKEAVHGVTHPVVMIAAQKPMH